MRRMALLFVLLLVTALFVQVPDGDVVGQVCYALAVVSLLAAVVLESLAWEADRLSVWRDFDARR